MGKWRMWEVEKSEGRIGLNQARNQDFTLIEAKG